MRNGTNSNTFCSRWTKHFLFPISLVVQPASCHHACNVRETLGHNVTGESTRVHCKPLRWLSLPAGRIPITSPLSTIPFVLKIKIKILQVKADMGHKTIKMTCSHRTHPLIKQSVTIIHTFSHKCCEAVTHNNEVMHLISKLHVWLTTLIRSIYLLLFQQMLATALFGPC